MARASLTAFFSGLTAYASLPTTSAKRFPSSWPKAIAVESSKPKSTVLIRSIISSSVHLRRRGVSGEYDLPGAAVQAQVGPALGRGQPVAVVVVLDMGWLSLRLDILC